MSDPDVRPFWLTAFLDLPAAGFDATTAFWAAVSAATGSPARGRNSEFVTLQPASGDPVLKAQRVGDAVPRLHLDVHVGDVAAAAEQAVAAGAGQLADHGYRVLRSPGGLVFCLVDHPAQRVPGAHRQPDGARSRVDQVCIDAPYEAHDAEAAFWSAVLGAPLDQREPSEFSAIDRRPELPVRVLVQRLGERSGRVRAHLDVSCDDRPTVVAAHTALGAAVEQVTDDWTVLRDPAGSLYCVIERDPFE